MQVIQRRFDFGEPRENFNRDWADYKNGFGDPAREFWLGNENIYMLTNNEDYMLRIELEDFEGNKRYAFVSTDYETKRKHSHLRRSDKSIKRKLIIFLFAVTHNIRTSKFTRKLITTN